MAPPLTLADLGETAVIDRLIRLLPASPPSVLTGPGDDCAVIQNSFHEPVTLLKADSVVEGIHFLSGEQMQRVGWKAICRAVSDIAAMGGRPLNALIAVAAKAETPWQTLENFYSGISSAAKSYNLAVVGGETVRTSGPFVCSIFLTGTVAAKHCILRSGGRPGDVLLVTGKLGGSFASGRHLDFTPRLAEGQWLAKQAGTHAMMDLSDGLSLDAPRLAKASRCGLKINVELIPRNEGCGVSQAVGDGEDFELLVAVAAHCVQNLLLEWSAEFPELPLSPIGSLTESAEGFQPEEIFTNSGYDHFQQS
jgi:thiamine-monophosphate kinase